MNANSNGGPRPPLLWPLVVALLFFGGGYVGNQFISPQTHAAYVWPATGVTIAVLSLVPLSRWPAYLVAIGLAAVGVSLVTGESIGISLAFAVVELVTSGLAHLPPIKVVTILSGAVGVKIWLFIAACLIARSGRFLGLAWAFARYGDPIRDFVEHRLGVLAGISALLIVAIYLAARYAF